MLFEELADDRPHGIGRYLLISIDSIDMPIARSKFGTENLCVSCLRAGSATFASRPTAAKAAAAARHSSAVVEFWAVRISGSMAS
jgi:hypothetical protein